MESFPTPNPTVPSVKLAIKIIDIMSQLQRLAKNGYNDAQHYHYVQEADVTDELRRLMAQARLVLFSQIESVAREGDLTTVWMQFTLMDADSGTAHVVRWPGQGQDHYDKGIAKAITAATKYFLLKTFMLSAGDDPEQTNPAPHPTHLNARRKVAAPTPESPPAARPVLPADPFAVRILTGTLEPRKLRNGESALLFRGQATLESTQETFGITAWRAHAQLLHAALRDNRLAIIQGQWQDQYGVFQIQETSWPPATPDPTPEPAAPTTPAQPPAAEPNPVTPPVLTPKSDEKPDEKPAAPKAAAKPATPKADPKPAAVAPVSGTTPSDHSKEAIKQDLWALAQARGMNLPALNHFASQTLGTPITNLTELPLEQIEQVLTGLKAAKPPAAS